MKKIIFAVLVGSMFTACNTGSSESSNVTEDTVVVDTINVVDSVSVDSVM